jgi:hypothetical protein
MEKVSCMDLLVKNTEEFYLQIAASTASMNLMEIQECMNNFWD